jgi:hypothetical protein
MAMQIKVMSDQIAQLTRAMANKENTTNVGSIGSSLLNRGQAWRDVVQNTKPRSIGCYCSLHGFQPDDKNHTSTTCLWK